MIYFEFSVEIFPLLQFHSIDLNLDVSDLDMISGKDLRNGNMALKLL